MEHGASSLAMLAIIGISVCVAALNPSVLARPVLTVASDHTPTVNFHTPILREGLALPQHITGDTTVGPEQGTILINALITITPNATLTIKPGTTIAVSEFGGISVFGNLHAVGTATKPITFITNEQHEANRHWVGILLQDASFAEMRYVSIHHASPAMSCSPGAKAILSHIIFECQDIQSGAK
ncbi:MAG: hypothetical protein A3E36_04065 [Candidatus Andersenbacteria bacterium RIFCSPHIGHO2_12_FULL_45_11b]|uniref:Uncharacterized protein n=1 Tax=Candidatus Andersenbacteria bacterium RIFCSPHIGHO2_12_FULL_45_11b TaxID=1797282 RepID=A0A1G1XAV6_9BACT|nr:MAG: hypothetical protein A3E36_04065 [Candidatus Andersenbacteria bacterium RIFCSPHIGHO2_12_FULL_45_11b]